MKYAISRRDGGVSIMSTQGGVDPWDEIAKWPAKDRDAVVGVRDLLPIEEIEDRTFRNAWTDDGRLKVDMERAREVWRQYMRKVREPLLRTLDGAYLQALEKGDTAKMSEAASQKQALRDVTSHPDIEAAKTPEELRAVWPEVLSSL